MATTPVVSYPFDPTGRAATNRIKGEQLIVVAPGDRLFHFTMPKYSPFFEEGLTVKLRDLNNNVTTLVKGVDYYLSHKFMDASLATMHPIWGSITFLRRDIVGTVVMDYSTLGGIWTIDSQKITEILINTIINPRTTSWEEVVERPVDFPVIDHPWNLDDMVGQKEILEVLTNFYNAYLASLDPEAGAGGSGVLVKHIQDRANPHGVTAAQTGAYSKGEIDTILTGYLKSNATAVNSDKLGGKSLSQLMTDVAAATVANATKFNGKTYSEVMAEIALSKVAMAETADDSLRFNGKTYAEVMAEVKATKVDLATKADDSGKLGGQTLAQILASIPSIKVNSSANADDSTRLGGRTYAEVIEDAKLAQAEAGTTAANSLRFNGKTYAEVMTEVKATKVDAAVKADKATDAERLSNKTLQEIMDDVKTTVVDSAVRADSAGDSDTLAGKTLEQIMLDVETVKVDESAKADTANMASDAERVYGMTQSELARALMANPASQDGWVFGFNSLDVMSTSALVPGDGGTADDRYYYALLGEYTIPVTSTFPPNFISNGDITSSFMEVGVYLNGDVHNARIHFGVDAPPSTTSRLAYFSDRALVDIGMEFGYRTVVSDIESSAGDVVANTNELFVRYDKTKVMRRLGITQHLRNSFAVVTPDKFTTTDHTDVRLNDVVWVAQAVSNEAEFELVNKAIRDEASARVAADTAILNETQQAFDQLAAAIDNAIVVPAA